MHRDLPLEPRRLFRSHRSRRGALRALAVGLALTLAVACVSPPPPIEALDVEELTLAENEGIRINQALILFDASGSMEARSHRFESTQNIASSFAMGMPEGAYEAAVVTFGGEDLEVVDFEPFDRDTVDSAVFDSEPGAVSTDIPAVLEEAAVLLAGRTGRSAVIVFSDGVAQRDGRNLGVDSSIKAARRLQMSVDGEVCFYTIQSGEDPQGTELMQGIAELSGCGQHRLLTDIADADALRELQQVVFVEEVAPVVSAPPPVAFVDEDEDGVEDESDDCLGTPAMANVNDVGCWVLDSYTFDTKRYEILESQYPALDKVAEVLKMNPELRIRIDGHTDSTGTDEFNQTLSEDRASAVGNYLEEAGIDPERLETRGFGTSAPIDTNDTPEGKARNRRCQLTVLR
ncbi:MAG: OmpA family protein [Myxococcota bacterium]|jgi:OOP family OmpA-OmpF porin|nr:OmpA family protein [Myxococcota bacterium]